MSGIFGLFNQDGAPAAADDIQRMASLLTRRAPDGTGIWNAGPVGLGHTLLATTPEALLEHLPLEHAESGCVVTADVRLDNRAELLDALDLVGRAAAMGDAGLILAAYLRWGTACVEHFLGDFAFAIWDSRKRTLFCARDHFGMRPLHYHHSPGRFFAFATEPRAILVLPQTPYRINEGRIADFLTGLEDIDQTSTFFEEVYRLPPAHILVVTREAVRQWRYWVPEPGPELRLPSDEAYAEALLDVLTEAVRCRLRGAGPVGAMLSGGMDSSSVVAVARGLLAEAGQGRLPTFSAMAPDPTTCIETRTIQAALTMEGLDPSTIDYGQLDELMPELEELTWNLDEPFDSQMTLIRAIYLLAHRRGLNVLLDGVGGDLVLSAGSYMHRLIRTGRWRAAYQEEAGQQRFYGSTIPAWKYLGRDARSAMVPNWVRRLRYGPLASWRMQRRAARCLRYTFINPDFAHRIWLAGRWQTWEGHNAALRLPQLPLERARTLVRPFLAAGRERYDRVAAAVAVEPRDPFLDLRVVAFCLSLPGAQLLSEGWPKSILRRAMAGRLPDSVRWRPGKQHLGWSYTQAFIKKTKHNVQVDIEANKAVLLPYVDVGEASSACSAYLNGHDSKYGGLVYDVAHLAVWLRHNAERRIATN